MLCMASRAVAVSTPKCDPSSGVLAPHIAKCTETLSAQAVGNALHGLQGCSGKHSAVRSVLRALAPPYRRTHASTSRAQLEIGNGASTWPTGAAAASTPDSAICPRGRWLRTSRNATETLGARAVGKCFAVALKCLQQRALRSAIHPAGIRSTSGNITDYDAQAVGNASHRLKACSSGAPKCDTSLGAGAGPDHEMSQH